METVAPEKHFSINNMHIVFELATSSKICKNKKFFYKSLTGKVHCFLPIQIAWYFFIN